MDLEPAAGEAINRETWLRARAVLIICQEAERIGLDDWARWCLDDPASAVSWWETVILPAAKAWVRMDEEEEAWERLFEGVDPWEGQNGAIDTPDDGDSGT